MRWFEGQIPAAISKAKQQKSLFVVYITSNESNEDAQKMDQTWEEGEVSKACEEAGLVVMRFQAESDECKQFSVFYPVICVPCVYMISGDSGTLLESVAGFASPSDLVQKMNKAMETLKQGSVSTPGQSAPAPATTSAAPQSEAAASAQPTQPAEASSPSSSQKETARERATRMRLKMEEAHRKKEEQKKEAEKQKEMERRREGQAIQKADQKKNDNQARQAAEDIRKEKLEDKVAREKVLQQLARDKAEKNARFQSEKEKREQQKIKAQQEKEAAERREQARAAAVLPDVVTLQFRLPDGSTMTNQFPSGGPLQEALDFVTENVGAELKEFTMSTTYPRRNFGPDDMQTSFIDHGLSPRAAIVILPGRLIPTSRQTSQVSSSSSSSSSSSNDGIFSWFLSPILFVYNFLYSMMFGTASVTSPSPSSDQPPAAAASQAHSSGDEDSPVTERRNPGARPKSSYARRRVGAGGGTGDDFSRREGNVHRLNTQQADNDENNTWNGNSTQQM